MNLNEALETLENAGYLVESVNTPALVENLSEILLEVFEFDNASQLKSTVPNVVCYGLDDGEHDVSMICEYFYEKDVLRVTLNYGDFEDTFVGGTVYLGCETIWRNVGFFIAWNAILAISAAVV